MSIRHSIKALHSFNLSTLRAWRGTMMWRDVGAPAQLLELYDIENDTNCREIREILTELNLDVLVTPCPPGSRHLPELEQALAAHGLDVELPVLRDLNAAGETGDAPWFVGRDAVRAYLLANYGRGAVPRVLPPLLYEIWNASSGWLVKKLQASSQAKPASKAELPLLLYSFESSPASRLVRAALCDYQLRYELRNVGKEQISDFGPNGARLSFKKWQPVSGGRRERMIEQLGQAQFPYLEDPNTGAKLFESKHILVYLKRTYALGK